MMIFAGLMLLGYMISVILLIRRHRVRRKRDRLASIATGIARQQGWLCFVLLALAMSSASAQQPAPPSEYTIKLTSQELNVIGEALGELAFKKSAPVINSIQKQVNEKNISNKPEEPKKDDSSQ